MNKIKYGVIGAGQMGRNHLECLEAIDDIEITAVADNYEGSLGKFRAVNKNKEIDYHSGYQELLDRNDTQVKVEKKNQRLRHSGGVYFEQLAFIDNIRNGKKPLMGIEAAKWSTLVGLAAEESAGNGGAPVTL